MWGACVFCGYPSWQTQRRTHKLKYILFQRSSWIYPLYYMGSGYPRSLSDCVSSNGVPDSMVSVALCSDNRKCQNFQCICLEMSTKVVCASDNMNIQQNQTEHMKSYLKTQLHWNEATCKQIAGYKCDKILYKIL